MQTKSVDADRACRRSAQLDSARTSSSSDARSAGIPPALANLKRQRPELGVVIVRRRSSRR